MKKRKRKKRWAKAWICKREGDEEVLHLCYDHTRHFLTRHKRTGERAPDDGCHYCAESVTVNDFPVCVREHFLECHGNDITETHSPGTRQMMENYARAKAAQLRRRADDWDKLADEIKEGEISGKTQRRRRRRNPW